MDEKVIDGKCVFSTFHTVKGRQRKHVFVLGFDRSYFSIYARNMPTDVCPNTLYVACTRATHALFVLESSQYATDAPLPFLKMDHHELKISGWVDFKGSPQTRFWTRDPEDAHVLSPVCQVTVSDLIRFIPEDTMEDIAPKIQAMFVKHEVGLPAFTEEDIPGVTSTSLGHEDVSDLNGIAIPCMYYTYLSGKPNVLYKLIETSVRDMRPHEHSFLKQVFSTLSPDAQSVADYLYLSNVYTATQEGLYFKLKQIRDYTWIRPEVAKRCMTLLDHIIGETEFISEEQTILSFQQETEHVAIDALLDPWFPGKKFRFKARVDLISDTAIWEL
jgi:hypothetical protein